MAGLMLKQYVLRHWSQLSQKFVPPLTPDSEKDQIKATLPLSLGDPSPFIRSATVRVYLINFSLDI